VPVSQEWGDWSGGTLTFTNDYEPTLETRKETTEQDRYRNEITTENLKGTIVTRAERNLRISVSSHHDGLTPSTQFAIQQKVTIVFHSEIPH